jgi:hypothetical protein
MGHATVAGDRSGLELRPPVLRHLNRRVAHAVRRTALPLRAREAALQGFAAVPFFSQFAPLLPYGEETGTSKRLEILDFGVEKGAC